MQQPLRHPTCPLCGGANACAPAACGRFDVDCWCRAARFAPELLARVPAAQRGLACICRRCADGAQAAPLAVATHADVAARDVDPPTRAGAA